MQPLFLLTALDYALSAGDNDAARLTVTESIVPRGVPQSVFRFDLESGVFDHRSNFRKLEVNAVTDAAGNKLSYHHNHGSLLGTMFMTQEAFSPALGDENRYYSQGVNKRFAHEIAHQYWGSS